MLECSEKLRQFLKQEQNKNKLSKWLFSDKKRDLAISNIIVALNNLQNYQNNNQIDEAKILRADLLHYVLLLAHTHYANSTLKSLLDNLYFQLTFPQNQSQCLTILSPGTMIRSDRHAVASTEAVKQFDNVIFLDGVGISSKHTFEDKALHPIPGLFDGNTITKVPKSRLANTWLARMLGTVFGIIRGTGEDNNINYVLNILRKLHQEKRLPKKINLVGFSRGDVQNLKLAHKICAEFGNEIQINLIGEPVAGPGTKSSFDKTNLPPNVKFKISFLSLDVENTIKKYSNAPQDANRLTIQDTSQTKHIFLTSPGTHKEQDIIKLGKNATPAYHHNYLLITEFLLANGAKPLEKDKLQFTSDYEHLDLFMTLLHQKNENLTKLPGSTVRENLHKYVKFPNYFIHELHANLFEQVFPVCFRVFFHNNLYILQEDRMLIAQELQIMAEKSPSTYQFLIKQLKERSIIETEVTAIEEIKNKETGCWSLQDDNEIYRSIANLPSTAKASLNFFTNKTLHLNPMQPEETYMQKMLCADQSPVSFAG